MKGTAKTAHPRIGRLLTINMPESMQGASNLGTYRITKVVHTFLQNDRYECQFEGIPGNLKAYPAQEVKIPSASSIRTTVVSNEDPLGQGRVRVDFPFASDRPSDSWLRVMTPNAGSSSEVPKNRGLVFIPEKDDQVMVGFEFGDPNRPYVMGSLFHGQNSEGGGANNAIKSIITKSGIKIVFNDDEKSLHIEDPSGNIWDMDGKGNIEVNAPETFSVNAKNMIVEVTENMDVNVGQNINETAGGDINQTASGDIKEKADSKTEIIDKNYQQTSENTIIQSDSITASSTKENMVLQSGKTVKLNSAEKTNLF